MTRITPPDAAGQRHSDDRPPRPQRWRLAFMAPAVGMSLSPLVAGPAYIPCAFVFTLALTILGAALTLTGLED